VFSSAGATVRTDLLFFTKGKPTTAIWYYDLSDINVTKTKPLTADHFNAFFQLLPSRASGPQSWTLDIRERRRLAAEMAQPFKDQATRTKQQVAQWKERLKELRRANGPADPPAAEAEAKIKALTKEAKDAAAKAKEVEDAVYDLKAVNPNRRPSVDTRTPEELLDIIEAKGKEIAEALATLRDHS
jgi:type I restriction enzyme M protein